MHRHQCDRLLRSHSLLERTRLLFWASVSRIPALPNATEGRTWFLHWEIAFIFRVILPLAQLCNLSCQILSLVYLLILCYNFSCRFLNHWDVHFCNPIKLRLLLSCAWEQKCIFIRSGCDHLRCWLPSSLTVFDCDVFLPFQSFLVSSLYVPSMVQFHMWLVSSLVLISLSWA